MQSLVRIDHVYRLFQFIESIWSLYTTVITALYLLVGRAKWSMAGKVSSLRLQKVSLLRESWMWEVPCTLRMVLWCVEAVLGCSSALNANTKSVTSTMPPSLQPMRTYIAASVTPRTTLLGSLAQSSWLLSPLTTLPTDTEPWFFSNLLKCSCLPRHLSVYPPRNMAMTKPFPLLPSILPSPAMPPSPSISFASPSWKLSTPVTQRMDPLISWHLFLHQASSLLLACFWVPVTCQTHWILHQLSFLLPMLPQSCASSPTASIQNILKGLNHVLLLLTPFKCSLRRTVQGSMRWYVLRRIWHLRVPCHAEVFKISWTRRTLSVRATNRKSHTHKNK